MRTLSFLAIATALGIAACSSTTSNSGDNTAGLDATGGDLGLASDLGKSDGSPGTDAVAVKDAEALDVVVPSDVPVTPDVPQVADVPDVAPIADVPPVQDVPPIKDVPPPQDIQTPPDVPVPTDSGNSPDVAEAECPSGIKWIFGALFGSDLMEPGLACIDCHSKKGPKFTIAGTVYPGFHTVDTCNGVASIKVEITGNDGKVVTLTTNAVGNFHGTDAIAMPFTARVIDGSGNDRKMFGPQTNGDCNICHTQTGTNGAPGRIHAP